MLMYHFIRKVNNLNYLLLACEYPDAPCSGDHGHGRCQPHGMCMEGERVDPSSSNCLGLDCQCCVPIPRKSSHIQF